MIQDIGEMKISEANDANVPVVCFLHEPDEESTKWRWTAINFMPRKERCGSMYEVEADTRQEIVDMVNRYVLPLYEAAYLNIKRLHENYYWELKPHQDTILFRKFDGILSE